MFCIFLWGGWGWGGGCVVFENEGWGICIFKTVYKECADFLKEGFRLWGAWKAEIVLK